MKLGLIGAGKIALEFLDVVKDIESIEIINICATKRSIEKLKDLQSQYEIRNHCTNVDEILNDDIDAVYISVYNDLHFEIAKKALLKNKHVLLEKPFTSNYEEAKELINIANERNLIIFEAISNQFLPNYYETKTLVENLGDIKIVELNFSQFSSRYMDFKNEEIHPVFSSEKAGGTLVDLNVYNIYFIVGLFGEPLDVTYYPNIEKGVDTSGILILEYNDFKCVAIASKDSSGLLSISIQGNRGFISSNSACNSYDDFTYQLYGKEAVHFSKNGGKHRLYFEIIKFHDVVTNMNFVEAKILNERTLTVMKILDKARKY